MGSSDALEEATVRLTAALEALEDAAARQTRQADSIRELHEKIAALTAEREQLAAGLEAERRRADRLETANGEATSRLDGIIDSVRSILQTG